MVSTVVDHSWSLAFSDLRRFPTTGTTEPGGLGTEIRMGRLVCTEETGCLPKGGMERT